MPRVTLAKLVAANSGPAPSVQIRSARPAWCLQSEGGYGGTVQIQTSASPAQVTDAAATWNTFGTLADNTRLDVNTPIGRIRVNSTAAHTGSTASVYLLESIRPAKYE